MLAPITDAEVARGESLISSLAGSSACSIPLTVLHLLLACLPRDARMLTACQSLRRRGEGDSVPDRKEERNAGALHFFDTGVGLQQLAQILRQSFKLTIVFARA